MVYPTAVSPLLSVETLAHMTLLPVVWASAASLSRGNMGRWREHGGVGRWRFGRVTKVRPMFTKEAN